MLQSDAMRGLAFITVTTAIVFSLVIPGAMADEKRASGPFTAYVIGDSVLLGAATELMNRGMAMDAITGRRPTRLPGAMREIPNDGKPIIIHLGTNGVFTREVCAQLQSALVHPRPIIFITIRAPHARVHTSNDEIRQCARTLPGSVVVPWHRIANITDGVLYADGIHLTPTGVNILVAEITQALSRVRRSVGTPVVTASG